MTDGLKNADFCRKPVDRFVARSSSFPLSLAGERNIETWF